MTKQVEISRTHAQAQIAAQRPGKPLGRAALAIAPPVVLLLATSGHFLAWLGGAAWVFILMPLLWLISRTNLPHEPTVNPLLTEWQTIRRQIFRLSMHLTSQTRSDLLLQYLEDMKSWSKSYDQLLGQKFSPSELTYSRYAEAGQTALLYMTARIRYAGEILGGHQQGVLTTEQQQKFDQAVGECQGAFQACKKITEGLSLIVTQPEATGAELQNNIDEMLALAERAPLYSLETKTSQPGES